MNTQQFLEQLLAASKNIAEKGKNVTENKLNIPEDGPEREQMLDGLKKGAAIAAVATVLLGTRGGRKLTSTAIKVGSLAAIGGISFKAYKKWKNNASGTPVNELERHAAEERSLLLLQAMVAAANADGHIDKEEKALIKNEILTMHLPNELLSTVEGIIENPPKIENIAKQVEDIAAASEVYIATRLFIDDDSSESEKNYLENLVKSLNLTSELVVTLDKEINTHS